MKLNLTRIPFLLLVALVLVGLAACTFDVLVAPEILPTKEPTVFQQAESPTTGSDVRPTDVPTVASAPRPTGAPTLGSGTATTALPLVKSTLIPLATATRLKPSPTALVLRNVPIEGGEPDNKFFAELVYPDEKTFTTSLWFRVYAHKPVDSKVDGEGIEKVDFTIQTSEGVVVHYRPEKTAGYCAFGGGEPDCVVWNFAEHQYTWPDGGKIVSGDYTLNVLVTSIDQVFMFSDIPFTIQVP